MAAEESRLVLTGHIDQGTENVLTQRAGDPINFGLQDMPAGVKDGVAKLIEIGFKLRKPDSQAKKADGNSAVGMPYFEAVGIADVPESIVTPDGQVVKVREEDRVDVPVYSVKKGKETVTKDDCLLKIMNHMKLLADNQNLFVDANGVQKKITGALLEATAAALRAATLAKPLYFGFTTSEFVIPGTAPGSKPFIVHDWKGSREHKDHVPHDPRKVVRDSNAAAPQQATTAPTPTQQPTTLPATLTQHQAPPTQTAQQDDVASLVTTAQGDPHNPATKAAQQRLTALAVANGHEPKVVSDADTWVVVAEMIKTPPAPIVNGHASGPQLGDVLTFVKCPFVDFKTRQIVPGRFKSVPVTVSAVNGDGSYSLLNAEDQVTVYNGVADDLKPLE